jgi:hypothetical protein
MSSPTPTAVVRGWWVSAPLHQVGIKCEPVGLDEPSAPRYQRQHGDEYDHCDRDSDPVELSVEQAAAMPLSLLVRLKTPCMRPAASRLSREPRRIIPISGRRKGPSKM